LLVAACRDEKSAADLLGSIGAIELHRETLQATRREIVSLLTSAGFSPPDADLLAATWLANGDFLLEAIPGSFDFVVGNPPMIANSPDPLAISMPLNLANHEAKAKTAIKRFWTGRGAARDKQSASGKLDQGERSAVTGGKNMDGFIDLASDLVRASGLKDAERLHPRRPHQPHPIRRRLRRPHRGGGGGQVTGFPAKFIHPQLCPCGCRPAGLSGF
jgi:hypothetical protein